MFQPDGRHGDSIPQHYHPHHDEATSPRWWPLSQCNGFKLWKSLLDLDLDLVDLDLVGLDLVGLDLVGLDLVDLDLVDLDLDSVALVPDRNISGVQHLQGK